MEVKGFAAAMRAAVSSAEQAARRALFGIGEALRPLASGNAPVDGEMRVGKADFAARLRAARVPQTPVMLELLGEDGFAIAERGRNWRFAIPGNPGYCGSSGPGASSSRNYCSTGTTGFSWARRIRSCPSPARMRCGSLPATGNGG